MGIDDEDESTFTITADQKMFHFQGIVLRNVFKAHKVFCILGGFSFVFICLLYVSYF